MALSKYLGSDRCDASDRTVLALLCHFRTSLYRSSFLSQRLPITLNIPTPPNEACLLDVAQRALKRGSGTDVLVRVLEHHGPSNRPSGPSQYASLEAANGSHWMFYGSYSL